jgi:hypothetical protein
MGEECDVFDATNERYNVLMYYVKMKKLSNAKYKRWE